MKRQRRRLTAWQQDPLAAQPKMLRPRSLPMIVRARQLRLAGMAEKRRLIAEGIAASGCDI